MLFIDTQLTLILPPPPMTSYGPPPHKLREVLRYMYFQYKYISSMLVELLHLKLYEKWLGGKLQIGLS